MPAHPLFRLRQPAIAVSAFAGTVMALAAPPSQPPQLSPATPASLVGTCEELGAKLGTLPQHDDHRRDHGPRRHAGCGRPVGRRALPRDRPVLRAREPGRRQDLRDRFGDAAAQGLERPLLPPGQRRHRRQRRSPPTPRFGGGPLTSTLLQGFAVLSSDAGHSNAQGGPAFGLDPQARLDYGYQAVGKLTPIGQADHRSRLRQGTRPLVLRRLLERRTPHPGRGRSLRATTTTASSLARRATTCRWRRWPTSSARSATRRVATGNPSTPAGLETGFTAGRAQDGRRRGARALRRARRRDRRAGAGHARVPSSASTSCATCPPAAARATAAA